MWFACAGDTLQPESEGSRGLDTDDDCREVRVSCFYCFDKFCVCMVPLTLCLSH